MTPSPKSTDLLDMNQAIDILKTSRPTFYRWLRTGKIPGMKVGRQWRFYREDLHRFLKGQTPRISLTADMGPLLETLESRLGKEKPVLRPQGEDDLKAATRMMIALGSQLRASEIHLDPCLAPDSSDLTGRLRMRIDGTIQEIATFDIRLLGPIAAEFKQMAGVDVLEKPRPQTGRIITRLIDSAGECRSGKLIHLRASFLPAALGDSVTLRLIDPQCVFMELKKIGYVPSDMEKLQIALREPWGLIILSGPTGSGKTTVLYSCLNEVSGPQKKAVSLEDPIEFHLPWVSQIEISESTGLTFARAIKIVLSASPDIVMISDIRDSETLQAALEAALSGCLVLTQLHASGAAEALKRMSDFGGDLFAVAEATKLIVSQRLVRKLCPDCSESVSLSSEEMESIRNLATSGGLDWTALKPGFRKAVGCDRCSQTGYRRRDVIAEVLEMSPAIVKALRDNASVEKIRSLAIAQGMITLAADGIRRASIGDTTVEEVKRVLGI